MKRGRLQCKDIPDRPILEMLGRNVGRWCFRLALGNEPDRYVPNAMPSGTPEGLVLAKMRGLIRRGLVDGCDCGCRGDFELTAKGADRLGWPDLIDLFAHTSPRKA